MSVAVLVPTPVDLAPDVTVRRTRTLTGYSTPNSNACVHRYRRYRQFVELEGGSDGRTRRVVDREEALERRRRERDERCVVIVVRVFGALPGVGTVPAGYCDAIVSSSTGRCTPERAVPRGLFRDPASSGRHGRRFRFRSRSRGGRVPVVHPEYGPYSAKVLFS